MSSGGSLPVINFAGTGLTAQIAGGTIYDMARKRNLMPPKINYFERNSDPGGRIKNRVFRAPGYDPVILNNGAQWNHRGVKNRFFQFIFHNFILPHARQFGVDPNKLLAGSDEFKKLFYLDEVNPSRILQPDGTLTLARRGEVIDAMESVLELFHRAQREALKPETDLSVAILGAKINPALAQDVRLLWTWIATNLEDASGKEVMADPSTSGGLVAIAGQGAHLSLLTQFLESRGTKFHMGAIIKGIESYDDHCDFIDQYGEKHSADEAGITFSMGVLQDAFRNNTISFGRRGPHPQLVRASEHVVMANMTKLAVVTEEVSIDGRIYFEQGKRRGFIDAMPHSIPQLTYGGPPSVEVEQMPPEWQLTSVCDLLRKLGQPYKNITPLHIASTAFNTSEETLGAYSILRVDGERTHNIRDKTATYGGEAFAPSERSPGTLEGACDSGIEMGIDIFERIESRLPSLPDDPDRDRIAPELPLWRMAA